MGLKKTCVPEEGSTEAWVAVDAPQAAPHAGAQAGEIVGGRVGQGGGVQMGPELFDRIQFRDIGGQGFPLQPAAMAGQGLRGEPTAMRGQPIPEQDHGAAAMALEAIQEADDVPAADAAAMQCQQPARAPTVGAGQQGSDAGHALPVEGFHQARRLPARRPGGADGGTLRETAFVHKAQPGFQPAGVFLPGASGLGPSERSPLRRVPGPVVPDAGGSTLTAGARAKSARASNAHGRPS
jgi:hypothetical protein